VAVAVRCHCRTIFKILITSRCVLWKIHAKPNSGSLLHIASAVTLKDAYSDETVDGKYFSLSTDLEE
jgi:hypothetical protein